MLQHGHLIQIELKKKMSHFYEIYYLSVVVLTTIAHATEKRALKFCVGKPSVAT